MGIKLVVGLGNPGKEYAKTRHNAGFIVVDELADGGFKEKSKNSTEEKKVGSFLYIKPQTFMNNSGQVVAKYKKFFKIKNEEIVVIHDDVDLTVGTARVRLGGGSAGHKGVESIAKAVKSKNFWRVRIGIGKPRNAKAMDVVLTKLSAAEVKKIRNLAPEIKNLLEKPEETTIKI